MAFTVPTFNLECEIWSGPWVSKSYRETVPCNLALGRRVQQQFYDDLVAGYQPGSIAMALLVPALTDLRDKNQGYDADVLEVPVGSGRWYGLNCYDDVGKGFDNEYRLAIITKISDAIDHTQYPDLDWPTPCP